MEAIESLISSINGIVWGVPMLIAILGIGIYLQAGLGLLPIRKIGYGFSLLLGGSKDKEESSDEGEISPFNALMTSLSATIGTGNIAGVATAVVIGGPGALFWMWCTALVGMATKYAEAVLAVKYREVDENGDHVGGPMYYIKNGLGKGFYWLAPAFAIFGAVAGFGIGNTVQANSVSNALESTFGVDPVITGIVLLVLTAAVVLGGIKRIGSVAGKLVPTMAIAYFVCGIIVLLLNADQIPAALADVFKYAFTPYAGAGGIAGATVWLAMTKGVARGVFSNEAGLGSAPIAHAAAKTNDPVRQGFIAMLGTFIDTIIICSITGLAILTSGAFGSVDADGNVINGAALTAASFGATIPYGGEIVSIVLAVFAFTTILGWAFYGEKCVEFLLGVKAIMPFRILWCLAVPLGVLVNLDFIWLLADTLNAMMALPNIVALALLSPVVFKMTKEYMAKLNGKAEEAAE